MRDNAKCAGNGCPVRETCDRFMRPAVDGQSWIEPMWSSLPSPRWGYPFFPGGSKRSCTDWEPVRVAEPVQPHGGAPEEGDAC